jgi:hypothetical protein
MSHLSNELIPETSTISCMLKKYSIKDLYALALAEGEGMGTAYEYYAKRRVLGRWLAGLPTVQSILVAGLPERYGASMDFVLLATELGARLTIIDDRPEALTRLTTAIQALRKIPAAPHVDTAAVAFVADLRTMLALQDTFDLALSSEVLQRLSPTGRISYVNRLGDCARRLALFAPNSDNQAHITISGLEGLSESELIKLMVDMKRIRFPKSRNQVVGTIDMPPFPPGITRSEAQRAQATRGRSEALAMWGLEGFAYLEEWFPESLRRKKAHIVYTFLSE